MARRRKKVHGAITAAGFFLAALGQHQAHAEVVQIPGPSGPLEGELIDVQNARHVVIIVPGSGPVDRNGNGPQAGLRSDTYRLLAEALAEEGISSIRIDKRGFFGSADAIADPNDATIASYADDALGWVEEARETASCVWLAGHSEGGLVALVASTRSVNGLCGVILLATAGRPISQVMMEQLRANPANVSLLPDLQSIVGDLEAGRTRPMDQIPPVLHGMFNPGLQRYMVDLFSYDPVSVAQRWSGPTLILQGDSDIQVKLQDAELLEQAIPHAERRDLAGATHMLKPDVPGQPFATYTDPGWPLHPDVAPAIASFVETQQP